MRRLRFHEPKPQIRLYNPDKNIRKLARIFLQMDSVFIQPVKYRSKFENENGQSTK